MSSPSPSSVLRTYGPYRDTSYTTQDRMHEALQAGNFWLLGQLLQVQFEKRRFGYISDSKVGPAPAEPCEVEAAEDDGPR